MLDCISNELKSCEACICLGRLHSILILIEILIMKKTNLDINNREKQWRQFCYYSANMQHLFPDRSYVDQLRSFKNNMSYFTEQEEGNFSESSDLSELALVGQSPCVIATFHYGRYRELPISLINLGCKLCIVVSPDRILKLKSYYRKIFGNDERLVFADAATPSLYYTIKRYTHSGFHILIYVDGGSGVQNISSLSSSKNLFQLRFANARVQVRRGFADLSYMLKLPIVSLCAMPSDETSTGVKYHVDIYTRLIDENRSEYVSRVVRGIYRQLESKLIEDPDLWECWVYMHKVLLPVSEIASWDMAKRYLPFKYNLNGFILDKFDYCCYPISLKDVNRVFAATPVFRKFCVILTIVIILTSLSGCLLTN